MKIAELLDRKAHPRRKKTKNSRFPFKNYYWEVDDVRNKMNNSSSWKERPSPPFLAFSSRKINHCVQASFAHWCNRDQNPGQRKGEDHPSDFHWIVKIKSICSIFLSHWTSSLLGNSCSCTLSVNYSGSYYKGYN